MATATVEQVFIGKMSLPQVQGQISLFALPQNFVWLKHFTAEEIPVVLTAVDQGLDELANEQGVSWAALKKNLKDVAGT